MTRLKTAWLSSLEEEIKAYDIELLRKTGCTLSEIAAKACGMSRETFDSKIAAHKVAAIPVTQGEGVISTFSQSVEAIAKAVGADAFVTKQTDVSGMAEALIKEADILLMADDDSFIALNVKTGIFGDNNVCTAKGYVQALELMAGDLAEQNVLVLGCGIVGREIVNVLKGKNARITIYDTDPDRVRSAGSGLKMLASKEEIKDYTYILDATNTGNWLTKDMLNESVMISTPGVPLSLTDEAMEAFGEKTVHDILHIGTAVMLGTVI